MLTMNSDPNLTVQSPTWDDPTATMFSHSPNTDSLLLSLSRYLPSNGDDETEDYDIPVDAYSCDSFRMFEFKIRKCARARSHDWTECPFAHPGEKARRRDPRKHRYAGTPCPEYRKGTCRSGDACEYAHGVFECWLHPSRYRTQPCKDGTHCRRRICFFAHTPDQIRLGGDSVSTQSESPPMSPLGVNSVSELATQMAKMRMGMSMSVSPPGWGGMGYGSPRGPTTIRPGFFSLPSTPTKVTRAGPGNGVFDIWEGGFEEEPVMERVESGRVLRAQMYAKLSRENSLGRAEPIGNGSGMNWLMG